jgi:transposase
VVGLYLSPPDNALVLCVDEKSQCQALERTQPMLPLGLGYVEGVTHDDVRHGTTTLFAALNVLNGAVLAECKPRHRHQEFLAFLRTIDKSVPVELDIGRDALRTTPTLPLRSAGSSLEFSTACRVFHTSSARSSCCLPR